MTREELFRAVGEVREDLVEGAETMGAQTVRPWRRLGALAACLALIVTVTAAASGLREADRWKAIVRSFDPSIQVDEDPGSWDAVVRPSYPEEADSGGGAAAGGLDGCEYDRPSEPLRPSYSTNVDIGELAGPGDGETMTGMSACLAWLTPEEIFAQDTVIFRGTVRDLQYYQVEPDGSATGTYYTRAVVEVTDSIRGGLAAGEDCSLLWLGAKGYMSTSISGPLGDLEVGSDAIFMPIRTSRDTGWREGEAYFCYTDLADLYLSEGMRYVFADTGEGLAFERSAYPDLEDAEALEEIAAYIRDMTGGTEQSQPAAVPAPLQPEPSETREAGPGDLRSGPNGARELPGGAYIGD